MKSAITLTTASSLLIALSTLAVADDFTIVCDGNREPDWNDCQTIANNFFNSGTLEVDFTNGGCTSLSAPDGTDPNSLNCVVDICNLSDQAATISTGQLNIDYSTLHAQCPGQMAGGEITDTTHGDQVTAYANPNFNPSKKREPKPAPRFNSRIMKKRQDQSCTNGQGTLKLVETNTNVERPGTEKAVTGRLPAGSSYTIQQTDSQTVGVSVSVSVEAGFFDLLSTTVDTTVSESQTESSTTGVSINIDCESGQEGIVYFYPVFTEYQCLCESDNNNEIDTWVPQTDQTNYMVTCLAS